MEPRRSGRITNLTPRYSGHDWSSVSKLSKAKKLAKVFPAAAPALPEEFPAASVVAAADEEAAAAGPSPRAAPSTSAENTAAAAAEDNAAEDDHTGPLTQAQQIKLVQKCYTNLRFPGAYAGIKSIKRSLLSEKNLRIPERVIAMALNTFPSYIKNLPSIKKYPRSKYDTSALGQLWQSDLAFVGKNRKWNGYVGFLLCIDCFSVSVYVIQFSTAVHFHYCSTRYLRVHLKKKNLIRFLPFLMILFAKLATQWMCFRQTSKTLIFESQAASHPYT